MADPSYELLLAVLERLKAASSVTAIVPATSIYPDDAPASATPPYVVIGETDALRDDATCLTAHGIFLTIHVWSWGAGEASGTVQTRKIGGAIAAALHDTQLALSSNRLVTIEHRRTQVFKDVDGVKNHGILEFWASVERPTS